MAARRPTFAKNKLMGQSRDIFFILAAKFVITNKTASITALQRDLGIEYNRAARIISELEEAGLVGPGTGFGPRKVLFDNMLDFVRSLPRHEEEFREHEWIKRLDFFCPAQIYYYFHDAEGQRWCIYLRWRHSDPWTAELVRCDDSWDFIIDGDWVNLLEETEHVPGTVTGYYREDEYEPLMEEALRKVRAMFKDQGI